MHTAGHSTLSDESLLHRVQQENQRRIFGKLLHDLRNPVHSLRITIELFARLARRTGDVEALMERAARYVTPAEAALDSLLVVTGRLALYLSSPAPPSIAALDVAESLDEIALLLGGGGREHKVEVALHIKEGERSLQIDADRPRLSHALLRHCCSRDGHVRLEASAEADNVRIDVHSAGETREAVPFTADEFRQLVERAGGALTLAPDRASLRFKRTESGGG